MKRRRWLQFRLSVMLGVVTIFAVAFALVRYPIEQTRHEAGIAKRMEEIGGRVTWGGLAEGRGKSGRSYIGAIDLTSSTVSDADLVEIGRLPALTHLYLNDTNITDSGIEHLSTLPRLKQLELSDTKITDNGVQYVARLTSLEVVKLERCNITSHSLKALGNLESLWMLHLDKTPVTDDAMETLAAAVPHHVHQVAGQPVGGRGATGRVRDVPMAIASCAAQADRGRVRFREFVAYLAAPAAELVVIRIRS